MRRTVTTQRDKIVRRLEASRIAFAVDVAIAIFFVLNAQPWFAGAVAVMGVFALYAVVRSARELDRTLPVDTPIKRAVAGSGS